MRRMIATKELECCGKKYTVHFNGYILETEEDYKRLVKCPDCGNATAIRHFKKEPLRGGPQGDIVAAPIYNLHCPFCYTGWISKTVAVINESKEKFSVFETPNIELQNDAILIK